MTAIKVRNLQDDLSFGSSVDGVNWETLADEAVRAELNRVFEDRGMIVFEDVEPTSAMQVAISKVFGPLKDHPTKATPRDSDSEDLAPGVIDMHYMPSDDPDDVRGPGRDRRRDARPLFALAFRPLLQRRAQPRRRAARADQRAGGRPHRLHGRHRALQAVPQGAARQDRDAQHHLHARHAADEDALRRELQDASAIRRQTAALLKEVAIFPRAMHPAVWTRKTGEKVLHIGPWMAVGVEHHEDPEGEAFFDEVCQDDQSPRPKAPAPTGTTGSRPTW